MKLNICRSEDGEKAVIKGVRHPRIQIERDALQKFKNHAIRPLVDEIMEPKEPPGIVLRYLDDDLLNVLSTKKLTRPEIKGIAKIILEALAALHKEHYVHTGLSSFLKTQHNQ
jgi:serine/threonine protein kinase